MRKKFVNNHLLIPKSNRTFPAVHMNLNHIYSHPLETKIYCYLNKPQLFYILSDFVVTWQRCRKCIAIVLIF